MNSAADTVVTFALPCYNAADYMDHCIESILEAAVDCLDRIQIVIVNDGSTKDDTAQKADAWHERHPSLIEVVHQENGGHGQAVNTGLAHARGVYYKVIDADDWVDAEAGRTMLALLADFIESGEGVDMLVVNYVYEKVYENKRTPIRYKGVLPEGRVFGWDEIGSFKPQQNLLMHAVVYRTQLLRDIALTLPQHTFYVDNIFVYVPLPSVKSIYYLNVDFYRYFIGREGQSVNEKVMASRIDQQLLITRIMIESHDLEHDVPSERLKDYMIGYLSMMMTICSVFLHLNGREDASEQQELIWEHLKAHNPAVYSRIRKSFLGRATNLKGKSGKAITLSGYRLAQKVFKFN